MTATANTERVTYQWVRADTETGPYSEISGATSKTYILYDADKDKYIKVKVTGVSGKATGDMTSDSTAKEGPFSRLYHEVFYSGYEIFGIPQA